MNGNRFRIHAILALSFLLLILGSSMVPVRGQVGGRWITSYSISNSGTGQTYKIVNFQTGMNTTTQNILAGDELNITFTISVSTSLPSESLTVSTTMSHSAIKSTYWDLQSKNYAGINSQNYNPNQHNSLIEGPNMCS